MEKGHTDEKERGERERETVREVQNNQARQKIQITVVSLKETETSKL